jgi:flagellar hook-length control protein FliK
VNHEVLGKLNINLNMDKGVLNVHINAAEKVTREFIENNIQHIVDALSKEGVSVGGFSVGLRNRNGYEAQEGNVFKMNDEQGSRGIQVLDGKARISAIHGLVSVFA